MKRKVLCEKNGNKSKLFNGSVNASIRILNGFKSASNKDGSMVVCTSYNEFAVSADKS